MRKKALTRFQSEIVRAVEDDDIWEYELSTIVRIFWGWDERWQSGEQFCRDFIAALDVLFHERYLIFKRSDQREDFHDTAALQDFQNLLYERLGALAATETLSDQVIRRFHDWQLVLTKQGYVMLHPERE